MAYYTVHYEVDVWADTNYEAAQKAWKIMQDPDSIPPELSVHNTDTEEHAEIDLWNSASCWWCGGPVLFGSHYCNDDCRQADHTSNKEPCGYCRGEGGITLENGFQLDWKNCDNCHGTGWAGTND